MSLRCHFLVQVKRICRTLWETIALYTALGMPISTCEYYDDKGGYTVTRRVELYTNKGAELPKGWKGIVRFVKLRRWGIRDGKPFDELSFYVLSKPLDSAAVVATAIREHWSVENKLHWIKDVNLGEDDMTLRQPKTAAILAFLNNMACNILKMIGLKPTKDTFAKLSNKVNELYSLFNYF